MQTNLRAVLSALFLLSLQPVFGQFIARPEPYPFGCFVLCKGDQFALKVPVIQNEPPGSIPVGSELQVLLSSPTGSFTSGTTLLTGIGWALFPAGSAAPNYTAGPYLIKNQNGTVNDILVKFALPDTLKPGAAYSIKMRTSNGFISPNLLNSACGTTVTVTAPPANPLAQVPQNTLGQGKWIAHTYNWLPTAPTITSGNIGAQRLFDSANYAGHFLVDSLSYAQNWTSKGCPGPVNAGTSILCSRTQNYALRMLRSQDFAAGYYSFAMQGDDGFRFSLDSGKTWVLNSFVDQQFSLSLKSTNTQFPNGIFLSGPTNLVIEYFQHGGDAQFSFTTSMLTSVSSMLPAASRPKLALFPNPSKGNVLTYRLSGNKASGVLEVFAADGRRVYSQEISQAAGSVSIPVPLKAGLYLVRNGGLEAKWIIEN